MKCARCYATLKSVSVNNLKIDYCEKCQGIWCNKDELERLCRMEKTILQNSEISKCLEKDSGEETANIRTLLICPECEASLTKYDYSYESGIMLETCTICGGIWVDDGELSDIINYVYNL